ncbi:Imm45 family immunity protein [Mesorhizobium amorphae]|nr:Imm45 family immunity protein [Mesorhizobium amorphae]
MEPREEILDYLLFATHEASGLGLVRDCGSGAGNVLVIFPMEARVQNKVAISPEWLTRHWQEWVDGNSASGEVWVSTGGRSEPEKLPEE